MRKLLCFTAALIIFISGCGRATADTGKFTVVTSFYPIYLLTANIADDIEGVQVVNMAQPQTGCLHDYQLSTRDMKLLDTADIFVLNGGGMESFLDQALTLYPDLTVIDSSQGVSLLPADTGHHHEETATEHTHEEVDSHIWLSLPRVKTQIRQITEGLASADPSHREQYESNREAFLTQITSLEEAAQTIPLSRQSVLSFHEAFGYIAEEFDLDIAASIDMDENTEPSAKELTNAIDEVHRENIHWLFFGDEKGRTLAETIAAETSARIVDIDPITSGPLEKDAYIKAMTKNLEKLKEALTP